MVIVVLADPPLAIAREVATEDYTPAFNAGALGRQSHSTCVTLGGSDGDR